MNSNKSKRRYDLLSEDGEVLGCYTGTAPCQAASKAASKGHSKIYLRDKKKKKIHVYDGKMEPLRDEEHTRFTIEKGISHKPVIRKRGTKNDDSVTPEYAAMEQDCYETDPEQCGTKPHCRLHQNGACYWPDAE